MRRRGCSPPGWPQAWKDFTKANWNKDPVGDYQDWDDIHDSAKLVGEETLGNTTSSQTVFVDPVAAKYLKFEPDTGVNSLTYRNVAPLSPEAGVQAIITYTDNRRPPRTGARSPSRTCPSATSGN